MFNFLIKVTPATGMMAREERAVKTAIAGVVDSRSHYGNAGYPHVTKFESAIQSRLNSPPVIATNSGTDALVCALKSLGVGNGDEVIVPAFSFISTVSCVPWVGATPIFTDIDPRDFSMALNEIERKITARTKAIIVAHLFGMPAGAIAAISDLAKKLGIPLIEDAAQSFGAQTLILGEWRTVGTIGDIGCLSFSSTKPFSAPGNGGAMVIRNDEVREHARRMCNYGAERHYYDYQDVGINAKIHEIQAAALLAKLPFFDHWLSHRKNLASIYTKALADIPEIETPKEGSDTRRIWYRFVIRTKDRDELYRAIFSDMRGSRSKTMINYPVIIPDFLAYKNFSTSRDLFPNARQATREVLSLPITNYTTTRNVGEVIRSIRRFFGKSNKDV